MTTTSILRSEHSLQPNDVAAVREKMLDKTLADSYPASDPLSSIPDPSTDSFPLEPSTSLV